MRQGVTPKTIKPWSTCSVLRSLITDVWRKSLQTKLGESVDHGDHKFSWLGFALQNSQTIQITITNAWLDLYSEQRFLNLFYLLPL